MNDLAKRRAQKEDRRADLEAQRRRHLQEVNEQNRLKREARQAKADKKAKKRGKS